MSDGTWTDQAIDFRGKGSEQQPITLRPQNPGKTILTGKSSIKVEGDWLVVSGVYLKDNTATGDGIAVNGNHCRLTDSAVVGSNTNKFLVHVFGLENRMDHCYLAEKTSEQPTLQIEVDKDHPNNDHIDHNHFGHRPPLGRNGGETIRLGYS